MADYMENELEFDLDTQNEEVTRTNNRIKSLSEKVKTASEERDALAKAKDEESSAKASAEKERDFYKNFNTVSSKYQGAADYQDKILEKVNAGYDIEDATIAILAKEGKYAPEPVKEQRAPLAGGSAGTGIVDIGDKKPSQMSRDELRQQLIEANERGEWTL